MRPWLTLGAAIALSTPAGAQYPARPGVVYYYPQPPTYAQPPQGYAQPVAPATAAPARPPKVTYYPRPPKSRSAANRAAGPPAPATSAAAPAPRPAAAPVTGDPTVRRQVVVPPANARGERARGMSGLDVPIDRRAYAGSPYQPRNPTVYMNTEANNFSAAAGPTSVYTFGAQVEAPNSLSGPPRYELNTYFDADGRQRSILYDRSTGLAREYLQSTTVGRSVYPAGSPPVATYGLGLGSYSGSVSAGSVDTFGPFGRASGGTTGIPSVNPVTPSVGISPGGTVGLGGTVGSP